MQRLSRESKLSAFATVASILCAIALLSIPNFAPPHSTGPFNAILNNIRKIEDAKELWANEHGDSADRELTAQDLAPFLPEEFRKKTVTGERYLIHRLPVPVEAVLTRRVQGRAAGTKLRLSEDLPNQAVQRMGASRSAQETNRTSVVAGSRR